MTIAGLGTLGWVRDLPDVRDQTADSASIAALLAQSTALTKAGETVPSSADLRPWFSPVEQQDPLQSCTANAGVGLLEYYEKRAFGHYVDASRLFLYKATRNLLGWTGDHGAFLRTTMQAMVLFGVPEEKYWPYDPAKFDEEPSAFLYSFAANYKSLQYYRLDPPGTPNQTLLDNVRKMVAAGLPSMFGFTVYSSISEAEATGDIPFPTSRDTRQGGHAVVVAGYDDNRPMGPYKGALLIRNSWGSGWGEKGYGWLPYQYVQSGLTADYWALIKADYVNTALFQG
jgi:C1A family cysteine protease